MNFVDIMRCCAFLTSHLFFQFHLDFFSQRFFFLSGILLNTSSELLKRFSCVLNTKKNRSLRFFLSLIENHTQSRAHWNWSNNWAREIIMIKHYLPYNTTWKNIQLNEIDQDSSVCKCMVCVYSHFEFWQIQLKSIVCQRQWATITFFVFTFHFVVKEEGERMRTQQKWHRVKHEEINGTICAFLRSPNNKIALDFFFNWR